MTAPARKFPAWVRPAVDYGAFAAFGIAIWLRHGIDDVATIVLMVGSVLAVAIGYALERRLAPLPLLSAAFALVFGGLSLIFHDKTFVKMKLTFLEGALALAMVGGVMTGRNPLKALMGDAVQMPDAAWRTLTFRYAAYFAAAAVLNEIVWRNTSDAGWYWFKLAVTVGAVIFALTQTPFILKHAKDPSTAGTAEPPDTGI